MDALALALEPRRARRARASASPAAPPRRLRVLVAEDNPVNQQVAVSMLKRAGHRPVVAATGREVLALLERERVDLVLMDVQMPELDGLETTAAIRTREREQGGHLPIVALTANAMKGDAQRCLAAGMDGYLAKPLHARELAEAMEGALAGHAAQRAPGGVSGPSPDASRRAGPAAADGPGVLDRARLLERVGGDLRSLARIARIFRDDYPKRIARMREAIADGDPRALRAAAHALKGAVANFAASGASDTALELQQMGEAGRLDGAPLALERLELELADVSRALAAVVRGAGGR
jgi:CheY-like chemotaxis protein/HPt (histidine-containing phosphotransfer) domain-containing protein